eukprot:m.21075 g.21075  ORF g.21075 m.21075 type:complete len:129 (+) comp10655_c0_seq1:1-387(+)
MAARAAFQLVNRNPRSLERLGKLPGRMDFVYRLRLELTGRHVTAQVQHHTGRVVLSASTREMPIAQQLYGTADKAAAHNIGRVTAQRMQESGISAVHWDHQGRKYHGKVKEFLDALEQGGISLKETAK